MKWDLVLSALLLFPLAFHFPLMMSCIGLTMLLLLGHFVDKQHVAPRLSLVNIAGLNKVLWSEVFVSENGQLRAIHLILDFELLSDAFQDVNNAISVGNPRLCRIDISVPGFLARKDLPPIELPFHRALPEVATLREETTSSRLSLKEEIDKFQLEEEKEEQGAPVIHISNIEDEFDRFSSVCTLDLVVARVVDSSKEEKEKMALNPRKGLRDLMARRSKGSSSKEVPKPQDLANLPLPLPPTTTALGLLPIPNLKKKRKE